MPTATLGSDPAADDPSACRGLQERQVKSVAAKAKDW
jgi:hypothetical protein